MVKFVMTTLMLPDLQYTGAPNTDIYYIRFGKPFEVTDEGDIEYFRNNPRFQEVSGGKLKSKTKTKKYTEKELYDMNKDEQVEILKKLKADKIPRLEKGRVELILELQ